jgi:hypothetical protein
MKTEILVLICLTLTGCAILPPMNEKLDWTVSDGFTLESSRGTGHRGVRGDYGHEYLYSRESEAIEDWTEVAVSREIDIGMTNFSSMSWNPESVMNSIKNNYKKNQCSTDTWTILNQDETSILFEGDVLNCQDYGSQHQITRIVLGKWYGWEIHYGIRNKVLTDDERAKFVDNLMSAKVLTVE